MDLVTLVNHIPGAGETILGEDLQTHPGGKGANQAVSVARLGYPVKLIGRVGTDSFGAQLRSHLQNVGVDCSGVMTTMGASGVALIAVTTRGENSIVVAPGVNARLSPSDIDDNIATIKAAGAVLTQLEIPFETVSHLVDVCSAHCIPLILDPAPATSLPNSVLHRVTWFTPNETEAAFFLGGAEGWDVSAPLERARALRSGGLRGVILKLGSRGAFLSDGDKEEHVRAFQVKVLDTTAAGDAFNGAFATGLMLGKSPLASALFASAAAAVSVTRAGAQAAMPSLEEVEALIVSTGDGGEQL